VALLGLRAAVVEGLALVDEGWVLA
jgi:hypothetical protein